MNLQDALHRAESLQAADRPAGVLARLAGTVTRNNGLAALLRGAWLGHPVHPLLVTVPIGAWLSAALLDLTGNRTAARQVLGLGLATVPAAVLAGLADYTDLNTAQRRVATAHVTANSLAATLAALSFVSRCRDRHAAGAVLNALGLAATSVGGALGGHLAYAQSAGVRRYNPPFVRRPDPVTVSS
jgi:uncharacterized membrane protein